MQHTKKLLSFILISTLLFTFISCNGRDDEAKQDDKKDFITLDNVSYGDDERQKFDITMPTENANGAVIVMIHGGAWTDGGKGEFGDMMYDYYAHGITFASIDYRFASDDISMDDISDDVTSALFQIKKTASENGIDLKNAMLGGISAGGQTALLYAYSKRDESPIPIKCCIGMSAVSDMTAKSVWIGNVLDEFTTEHKMVTIGSDLTKFEFTEANFDDAIPYLEKISPLHYAENGLPTILCHGQADDIIDYSIAVSMYNALTENGIKCTFIDYPHSGHTLESDDTSTFKTKKMILQYAEDYLY